MQTPTEKTTTRQLLEWCGVAEGTLLSDLDAVLDEFDVEDESIKELLDEASEILKDLEELQQDIKNELLSKER